MMVLCGFTDAAGFGTAFPLIAPEEVAVRWEGNAGGMRATAELMTRSSEWG